MAYNYNTDGSVTVTDDTGRLAPFVVPAGAAGSLGIPAPAPGAVAQPAAPAQPQLSLNMPMTEPPPAPVTMAQGVAQASPPGGGGMGGTSGAPANEGGTSALPVGTGPQANYTPGPGDPNYTPPPTPVVADAGGAVPPSELVSPANSSAPAAGSPAGKLFGGDKATENLYWDAAIKPGGYVAPQKERDVLKSFQVQKGLKPLSPEVSDLVKNAYAGRAGAAAGAAGEVAGSLEDVALAHARAADESRAEVAAIRERQLKQQAELEGRMKVMDSHVARINNLGDRDILGEYLANKGVGTRILVGLGALGSALTGAPNFAFENIKMELSAALQQQKMRLDAGHQTTADMLSAYGQMRATYTSPEAADSAAQALMLQATQQTVLQAAARVTGDETRAKYLDLAGQLGVEYALFRAKAEEAESDRITQAWQHKEAVAGGSYGPSFRNVADRIKYLTKTTGMTFDQAMEVVRMNPVPAKSGAGGRDAGAMKRHVGELMVQDPFTGEVFYAASPARAAEAEKSMKAGKLHLDNLAKIRALTERGVASGLPTGDKAKLESLIAENRYYLKGSLIKEALTAGELQNYAPMTAEKFLEFMSLKENASAQLDQIEEGARARVEVERKSLYRVPLDPGSGYGREQAPPPGATKRD